MVEETNSNPQYFRTYVSSAINTGLTVAAVGLATFTCYIIWEIYRNRNNGDDFHRGSDPEDDEPDSGLERDLEDGDGGVVVEIEDYLRRKREEVLV